MEVTTHAFLCTVTLLLTALSVVSGDNDTDQTTGHYPVTDGVPITTIDPNTAGSSSFNKTISKTNVITVRTTQKYASDKSAKVTPMSSTMFTMTLNSSKAKQDNQRYTGSQMSSQVNATSSTPKSSTGTQMSSLINATSSTSQSRSTSFNSKTPGSIGEVTSKTTMKNSGTSTEGPKTALSRVTNSHMNTTSKVTTTKMPIIDHQVTEEQTEIFVENTTSTGRLRYTYDEFDAGDKLWPVGMALTIGLPTIILLAVTITVLYKRQVAKPRSRMSFYGQNYAQM